MFKLDHLEISGFKSFVDPVSVKFTGSLNAIVGPNGCGKSNVADAVTWVLGERSAKTLRAERMEDVIFNGSQGRKPLGMAEVTLTLLADPSVEQAQDGRLVIGRRLFRSGESTYLINGKVARLKEIKDLLMGTGLGIRAYSVIEQGKIEAILSGKPQERRKLLEEAAGITKYKQRKHIAEIKLEEAASNLERIDDIVAEVERSLRSLKRQSNAARRYGDRKAEHDALLKKVLLKQWSDLTLRITTLAKEIAVATSSDAEGAAGLHRAEADLAGQRARLDELAEDFSRLREREGEIIATIEGKQEFIKGSRHLLRELADRLESGEAVAAHRRQEIERLSESRQSFESAHNATSSATEMAVEAVSETDSLVAQAEYSVSRAEEAAEALRSQLLTSLGAGNALRNEQHRLQLEAEKGSYRRSHQGRELGQKKKALEQASRSAGESARRLGELRQESEERQAECDSLAAGARAARTSLEQIEEELDRNGRDEAASRQRHEMLAELSKAHSDRRVAIQQHLEQLGQTGVGFLGDRVTLPAGWEQTLDLYLSELAEAVILPREANALEIGRALASGHGITRLLVPVEAHRESRLPQDPAIFSSLAEALGLPREIANALPAAYLVEDADSTLRLARQHPGIAFLSRDRLWAQSGVVHLQGEQAEPGALARDQEIERLAAHLSELEAKAHQLATGRSEHRATLERLARAQAEADEKVAECRRNLAVAEARQEDLEASRRRLTLECETLASERAEVDRELETLATALTETGTDLTAAETRHTELEAQFDQAREALETARSDREGARTSGAGQRGQLELLRERLESSSRGLERVRDEIDTHRQQLGAWVEEKLLLEKRQVGLMTAVEEAEIELKAALEGRSASESERHTQEEILREARGAQSTTEATVLEERRRLETVRESLSELRIREAAVRQEGEHLSGDYREHFGEAPPESFESPEEPLEELEADLERMKQLLHRMGPINELAAEEYSEQEERHEFLVTQRDDVMSSVERLRETIRDINETSSQRFLETFEQVNKSLGETFRKLFGGGEAEMRLMDEEDVLESAIEILARPPGKRLQNLLLLSGGEKALTALSLLFALFHIKPSPFCILDEVDAPLDDVNTMRFVGLLKQMARDTQFVVITHNKLTMSAASALYGVTMEERGVSRIVSVELDEIHPEEQAVSA